MTRTLHTLIILCCFIQHTAAQTGNEWIDYSRRYLRIPIAETGFYRITGEELARYDLPVDSISTTSIQIFRQGKEIALEATGSPTGTFSKRGHLLFYGIKNDGTGDSALYNAPAAMPHSLYGLYTDTTAYFLTWRDDGATGLRIQNAIPSTISDTLEWHLEEALQLFTSHYLPGAFYPAESNFENGSLLTAYDSGEGWTGPELAENTSHEIMFETPGLARMHLKEIPVEMLLAGWSPGTHAFTLWNGSKNALKRKLADVVFTGRSMKKIHVKLNPDDIDASGRLVLTLRPVGAGGHVSVSYARMHYPQESRFRMERKQERYRIEHSMGRVFQPEGMPADVSCFDISDPDRPVRLSQTNAGIMLAGATDMVIMHEPLIIPTARMLTFPRIDPATDYLIITHPLMRVPVNRRDAVAEYAQYRASPAGGKFKPVVWYSHEVFDQFNGGQPGPLGIMHAIRWLHGHTHLQFVLLAGQSIDPQKARKMPHAWQTDMVPNAGWPGSDIALATPKGSFSPISAIGRINAPDSKHLLTYLEKVKELEAEPASATWRKQILHVSGGRSRDELAAFRSYLKSFENNLAGSTLGAEVTARSKLTDAAVERVPIDDAVNRGAALLTIFGHSAPDMTDVDIGFASDPARNYRNAPRFPAVIVNGCASGSIFYSSKTLSSDWIFSAGNGAVLFLAHTFNGPSTALKRYTGTIYEVLADSAFVNKAFGTIQREAIRRNMTRNSDILDSITVQQMTLHGDPAIRIFPAALPDYAISPESVVILDDVRIGTDSTRLALMVRNNGRFRKETLQSTFTRFIEGKEVSRIQLNTPAMAIADTILFTIPNIKQATRERWLFETDPEQLLDEENEHNNVLDIAPEDILQMPETDKIPPILDVKIDGRVITNGESIAPTPYFEIDIFDTSLPGAPGDTSMLAIWLRQQCDGCAEKRIWLKNAETALIRRGVYRLAFQLPFTLAPGHYTFTVQSRDSAGNDASPYQITFKVTDQPKEVEIFAAPNPSGHSFRFVIKLEGPADEEYRLSIVNPGGTTVFEKPLKCHPGINEWYWMPGPLAAGTYHYKITAGKTSGAGASRFTQIQQGHLLYLH